MISRSAKVYEIVTNDADVIFNALKEVENNDESRFPRIGDVKLKEGNIHGKVWIQKPKIGTALCNFLFRTKTRKLYLLGITEAREDAYVLLKNLHGLEGPIDEMPLTNHQLVNDIREKLTRVNRYNFIKKMSLEFGLDGIRYHNSTNLLRLDYELIQNTCGSTHDKFDEFVNVAETVKVRFGIFEFGPIKRNKPASMNMRTDFTISFYLDIEDSDWYRMLDDLTFDPETPK